MTVKVFRRFARSTASKERVYHNAAFRTARQNTGFRQLRRERGKMPALVWDGVNQPYIPLVPHGGDQRVVVVAAFPRFVDPLHFTLSGDFLGVFVSGCASLPVPRRRRGGYRLGYGGSVIEILL